MAGALRRFNRKWLREYQWLRYSPHRNGGYCLPCVLFANSGSNAMGAFVVTPFVDFNKPGEKIRAHASTRYHQQALTGLDDFVKAMENPDQTVTSRMNDELIRIRAENTKKLTTIISHLHYLAKQGLPIRGHRDDSTASADNNRGNFIELLEHQAKVSNDTLMLKHISSCSKNARYTSKTVQNELLQLMADEIRGSIVKKVKKAGVFSILADEVTDLSNKEQLGVALRYVDDQGKLAEEFVEFIQVDKITGEVLSNELVKLLERLDLDINMLRGQSYDGAANMSSLRRGVAGRILNINDKAIYCHCSSHKLNLAIVRSCSIPIIRNTADSMGEVAIFFKSSPKRENMLCKVITETTGQRATKIKNVCRTRWIERHAAYNYFHQMYVPIVSTLEEISTSADYDVDSKTKANGMLRQITSSDFIISFIVLHHVMGILYPVSKQLQGRAMDVIVAHTMVEGVIQNFKTTTDAVFTKLFEKATSLGSEVGVEIRKPRISGRQVHRSNPPSASVEEHFRITVFRPFLDFIIQELTSRFSEPNPIICHLSTIIPPLTGITEDGDACSIESDWTIDTDALFTFYYDDLPMPTFLDAEAERWKAEWMGKRPASVQELYMVVICNFITRPHP